MIRDARVSGMASHLGSPPMAARSGLEQEAGHQRDEGKPAAAASLHLSAYDQLMRESSTARSDTEADTRRTTPMAGPEPTGAHFTPRGCPNRAKRKGLGARQSEGLTLCECLKKRSQLLARYDAHGLLVDESLAPRG